METISEKAWWNAICLFLMVPRYPTYGTFFSIKFIHYNIIRRGPSVPVSSFSGWLAHREKHPWGGGGGGS
jgi:hypothetical protein